MRFNLLIHTMTRCCDPIFVYNGATTPMCTRKPEEGCPPYAHLPWVSAEWCIFTANDARFRTPNRREATILFFFWEKRRIIEIRETAKCCRCSIYIENCTNLSFWQPIWWIALVYLDFHLKYHLNPLATINHSL